VLNSFGQKDDSLAKAISKAFSFTKKNSINFEAFGHGLWYSLSYERIIIDNYHYKLGGQIGAAIYSNSYGLSVWTPISINYIKTFGQSRNHHAEFGIGHVLRYDRPYNTNLYKEWVTTFISAKAGYRHQKPNSPWIFKVLFTPLLEYNKKGVSYVPTVTNTGADLHPYFSGALSIGLTF
jgi:hypothetical protein